VISFTLGPFYHQGNSDRYSWDRRPGGTRVFLNFLKKVTNSWPCWK